MVIFFLLSYFAAFALRTVRVFVMILFDFPVTNRSQSRELSESQKTDFLYLSQ